MSSALGSIFEATSPVNVIVSEASLPRTVFPVIERAGAVSVPVNVGDAELDFVATAMATLLNSVSISVPLTILAGLPEGRASFVAKFVALV